MTALPLSAEAQRLIQESFDREAEVSFALRVAGRALEPIHVQWGSENAVSIRAAPLMLHTHPRTCLNECSRTGPKKAKRTCRRDQDECIVGVPSASDIQLTLRCGLLGICQTHVVVSRQDGAYLLRVAPELPALFQRVAAELKHTSVVDAATALAELAFEHPNAVEDDFEDGFDETTYASWVARWRADVMRPGVRVFGIRAVTISHVPDATSLRVPVPA